MCLVFTEKKFNLTSPLLTTKTVCKVKMFLCKRVIVWLTHSGGIVENSQECVECFHVMHYSVLCSVGTYRQARSLQCQTIHKAIKPLSLFLSSLNYCLFSFHRSFVKYSFVHCYRELNFMLETIHG